MDLPLPSALHRTKVIISAFAVVLSLSILPKLDALTNVRLNTVLSCLILLGSFVALPFLLYGLVRLYTLLSHTLTTVILHKRGQRLRLLNMHTTVLAWLSMPLYACIGISYWDKTVAAITFGMVCLISIFLMGTCYNVIFHQQRWRGSITFLTSFALTCFVLVVGLTGIAAVALVLLLLLALFSRGVVR